MAGRDRAYHTGWSFRAKGPGFFKINPEASRATSAKQKWPSLLRCKTYPLCFVRPQGVRVIVGQAMFGKKPKRELDPPGGAGERTSRFAELLSDFADRKVVVRTDISGEFDIHLNLSAADLGHPPSDATDDVAKIARDPSEIFSRVRTAVMKLGLHMESARGPSESLFVERAEKPSAN
jgi:hypothetical protein